MGHTFEDSNKSTSEHTIFADLTPEELLQAEKLCQETSSGPWEYEEGDPEGAVEEFEGYTICHIQPHGSLNSVNRTGQQYSHADARFIAASRTLLPRALQQIQRLQEENQRLQAQSQLETERACQAEGELFYKTLSEVTQRVAICREMEILEESLGMASPGPWSSEDGYIWTKQITDDLVNQRGDGSHSICELEYPRDAKLLVAARNILPKLLERLKKEVSREELIKRVVGDTQRPIAVYLRDGTKIALRTSLGCTWLEIVRNPTVHLCSTNGVSEE